MEFSDEPNQLPHGQQDGGYAEPDANEINDTVGDDGSDMLADTEYDRYDPDDDIADAEIYEDDLCDAEEYGRAGEMYFDTPIVLIGIGSGSRYRAMNKRAGLYPEIR